MPDNTRANIATADALTLLLHNQHALGASIEEITCWISGSGADNVADNAIEPWKRSTGMRKRSARRLRDSETLKWPQRVITPFMFNRPPCLAQVWGRFRGAMKTTSP